MVQSGYFAIRGVIEGFYGLPWSHAERKEMLSFMGRHGYNAYFYSPKDDPYLRDRWPAPHPTQDLLQIDELIETANSCDLAFYYCLSPGYSMEYSSESHFAQLCKKYQQMCERGVSHFGLFFDDIPAALMHEQDKQKFQHLADAHVQVTLRLWNELRQWQPNARLVVCPTLYNGRGDEPYIRYLCRHLPTEILIFWTGRFVCSPYLTEADSRYFWEQTGHKPLYWDNYPVNDLAMKDELHIGPLQNRDPRLYVYASGYVANAMELVESSKIPLYTTAAYLQDPLGYDAEQAWMQAIQEVAGVEDREVFLQFADNVRSSFLSDVESVALMQKLHEFRFHFVYGDPNTGIALLRRTFKEMEETAAYLLTRMKNRKLAHEVQAWVKKLLAWAQVGKSAVELIDEGRRGRMMQAAFYLLQLKSRLKQAEQLPHKVCGHVMKLFVNAVLLEVQKR